MELPHELRANQHIYVPFLCMELLTYMVEVTTPVSLYELAQLKYQKPQKSKIFILEAELLRKELQGKGL